jgi:hypothetical protein
MCEQIARLYYRRRITYGTLSVGHKTRDSAFELGSKINLQVFSAHRKLQMLS